MRFWGSTRHVCTSWKVVVVCRTSVDGVPVVSRETPCKSIHIHACALFAASLTLWLCQYHCVYHKALVTRLRPVSASQLARVLAGQLLGPDWRSNQLTMRLASMNCTCDDTRNSSFFVKVYYLSSCGSSLTTSSHQSVACDRSTLLGLQVHFAASYTNLLKL